MRWKNICTPSVPFFTFVGFLCLYYVTLCIVTAGKCQWSVFAVSLLLAILLCIVVVLGILASVYSGKSEGGMKPMSNSSVLSEVQCARMTAVPPVSRGQCKDERVVCTDNDGSTNAYVDQNARAAARQPSPIGMSPMQKLSPLSGKNSSLPAARQLCLPGLQQQQMSGQGYTTEKGASPGNATGRRMGSSELLMLDPSSKASASSRYLLNSSRNGVNDDESCGASSQHEAQVSDTRDGVQSRRLTVVSLRSPARRDKRAVFSGLRDTNLPPTVAAPAPILLVGPGSLLMLKLLLTTAVILCLLLLGGSFWIGYHTEFATGAIPVFASPLLYLKVVNILRCIRFEKMNSTMRKVIAIIFHPIAPVVLAFIALALYAATVGVVLKKKWTSFGEWGCDGVPSMIVNAVCLLSPIPVFFLACSAFSDSTFTFMRSFPRDSNLSVFSRMQGEPVVRMRHPLEVLSNVSPDVAADVNDSSLSSIVVSRYTSASVIPNENCSVRSVFYASPAPGEICNVARAAVGTFDVGVQPQLKSLTMLCIAFRDIRCGGLTGVNTKDNKQVRSVHKTMETSSLYFQALIDASKWLEDSHGPFALTAHKDTLCFVWGLQPLSEDPILWAIDAAQKFFASFTQPNGSDVNYALVAAVLHSHHALVSIVGTSEMNNLHFLSDEYSIGEEMLERGFLLRGLEKYSAQGTEFRTSGLLLDRRAAHLVASQVLSRPVGIVPSMSCLRSGMSTLSRTVLEDYTVIYDFVTDLGAKEEEWHLAAHAREQQSASFLPAVEATEAFFKGNLKAAIAVLDKSTHDDNDPLMHLLLTDVKRIATAADGSVIESE